MNEFKRYFIVAQFKQNGLSFTYNFVTQASPIRWLSDLLEDSKEGPGTWVLLNWFEITEPEYQKLKGIM